MKHSDGPAWGTSHEGTLSSQGSITPTASVLLGDQPRVLLLEGLCLRPPFRVPDPLIWASWSRRPSLPPAGFLAYPVGPAATAGRWICRPVGAMAGCRGGEGSPCSPVRADPSVGLSAPPLTPQGLHGSSPPSAGRSRSGFLPRPLQTLLSQPRSLHLPLGRPACQQHFCPSPAGMESVCATRPPRRRRGTWERGGASAAAGARGPAARPPLSSGAAVRHPWPGGPHTEGTPR